jgi:lipopolysaccharide transport system permease protein
VQALIQVAFYVTPILFDAKMLGERDWIVKYNPLTYLLNVVREPLIGTPPSATSWAVSISMAVFGWLAVLYLTGKYHKRIPYWV